MDLSLVGHTKSKGALKVTFFHLDLEIREQVYKLYFEVNNGVIEPKANAVWSAETGLPHDRTSLLRTCQTIYAEATTVLYGRHTFRFSDRFDDCVRIHMDGSCTTCSTTRKKLRKGHISHTLGLSCAALSPKHRRLPKCSILYASHWMLNIGPRNRALVSHIDITLTCELYTLFESVYSP